MIRVLCNGRDVSILLGFQVRTIYFSREGFGRWLFWGRNLALTRNVCVVLPAWVIALIAAQSAGSPQHDVDRAEEDLEVEPDRPVIDVLAVEFHIAFERRIVSRLDLP